MNTRVCIAGMFATFLCIAPAAAQTQQLSIGSRAPGSASIDQQLTPGSSAATAPSSPTPSRDISGVPQDSLLSVQTSGSSEPNPTPAHTGFGALVRTIGADFEAFPTRRSTWVILGIGAGAALLAHPVDDDVNSHLVGSKTVGRFFAPGKWVGAAPTQAAVSIGLYVAGRYMLPHAEGEPKTNKVSHLGYDLLRAQIVSQAFVQATKFAVRRDRPNGDSYGFPSGHAATAFAVASVLERHLGYRAALPTLAIATYVATSRLHDNVHFVSDVLFGSAIGMATGWTVVGRHGRNGYVLVPRPVRGGFALALTRVPSRPRI